MDWIRKLISNNAPALLMAGAAITAVPILILYIFLQRYIVESVQTTGLKG